MTRSRLLVALQVTVSVVVIKELCLVPGTAVTTAAYATVTITLFPLGAVFFWSDDVVMFSIVTMNHTMVVG